MERNVTPKTVEPHSLNELTLPTIDQALHQLTKEASGRRHIWSPPTEVEIAHTRKAAAQLLETKDGRVALVQLLESSHGLKAFAKESISRTGMRSLLEMLRARGEEPERELLDSLREHRENLAYLNLHGEINFTFQSVATPETQLELLLDRPEPGPRIRRKINTLLKLPANLTFDRTSKLLEFYTEKSAQYAPTRSIISLLSALELAVAKGKSDETRLVAYQSIATIVESPRAFRKATEPIIEFLKKNLETPLLRDRIAKDLAALMTRGSPYQRQILLELIEEGKMKGNARIVAALFELKHSPALLFYPAEAKRVDRLLSRMLAEPLPLPTPSLPGHHKGRTYTAALQSEQELQETLADSLFTLHQIPRLKERCTTALLGAVRTDEDVRDLLGYLKDELQNPLPMRRERRQSAIELLGRLDEALKAGLSITTEDTSTIRPITAEERSFLRLSLLTVLRSHRSGVLERASVNRALWRALSNRD